MSVKKEHIMGHTIFRRVVERYGDIVETKKGNIYYRLPFWVQKLPNGCMVLFEIEPEDLSEYICKAGLGNPNPQIKRGKI